MQSKDYPDYVRRSIIIYKDVLRKLEDDYGILEKHVRELIVTMYIDQSLIYLAKKQSRNELILMISQVIFGESGTIVKYTTVQNVHVPLGIDLACQHAHSGIHIRASEREEGGNLHEYYYTYSIEEAFVLEIENGEKKERLDHGV